MSYLWSVAAAIDLEETENMFVCDKCQTTIKVMELIKDNRNFGYKIIAEQKTDKN